MGHVITQSRGNTKLCVVTAVEYGTTLDAKACNHNIINVLMPVMYHDIAFNVECQSSQYHSLIQLIRLNQKTCIQIFVNALK